MLNELKSNWYVFNKNEFCTPFKPHINEYDYHFVYFVSKFLFLHRFEFPWKKNRTCLKITNANRNEAAAWFFDVKWQFACKYHQWDVTVLSITFDWQYSAIFFFFILLLLLYSSLFYLYFDLYLNFKCEKEIDLIIVYVVAVVVVVVVFYWRYSFFLFFFFALAIYIFHWNRWVHI